MSLDEVKNHGRQATYLLSVSLNDLCEHSRGSLNSKGLIPLALSLTPGDYGYISMTLPRFFIIFT
jgi:hypothetical protein